MKQSILHSEIFFFLEQVTSQIFALENRNSSPLHTKQSSALKFHLKRTFKEATSSYQMSVGRQDKIQVHSASANKR